jgi:hypothetical protein
LLIESGGASPSYELSGGNLVVSNLVITSSGILNVSSHGTVSNTGITSVSGNPNAGMNGDIVVSSVTTQYFGQLQVSSSCTLDCYGGAGATTVRFADSHTLPWTGPLRIRYWVNPGARIFFGTNTQGLTAAQVDLVQFVGHYTNYPAVILSTGEVVPAVPPPLGVAKLPSALVLSWPGGGYELVTSTNVNGPYLPLPGAVSPFTNTFMDPQRFFRLHLPSP